MDKDQFLAAALKNPVNDTITRAMFEMALPDAWLVSGCLVQTVWNVLTGREVGYGINDYDIFYFDRDTSWEAEDAVIRAVAARLASLDVVIEARNQARVHLWYGEKHGISYPSVKNSTEGIDRFLTANTKVGIRRTGDGYVVYAPNGFDDIARMIARPNPGPYFLASRYDTKTARWKGLWPEITVLPAES